jgi:hypothetical protein
LLKRELDWGITMINKAELKLLEKMLNDMDKQEAVYQRNLGDAVKGTMRAVAKKRADALRKLIEYYKSRQTIWLG